MKIAVIIPVFNRKVVSLNCLRQLKERPHADITVIVIDDGSTDSTPEVIAEQYPEIILLKGEGEHLWTADINTGVRYAIVVL